jgi:hypothetical protein
MRKAVKHSSTKLSSVSNFRISVVVGLLAVTIHQGHFASGMTVASRLVYGKDDALFGCIENFQRGRSFGSVLDAGTGLHSLRWLATLSDMTDFCAVTADASMQRNVQAEVDALGMADKGKVLMGNWFADDGDGAATAEISSSSNHQQDEPWNKNSLQLALQDRQFDVILAD